MNRTKVILSIFLMLFLLLAGLVLPSFWKSQKKEASGNKGREPAKETTETNSDTPMPEYLDFDALKAFFSDSQIASLKGQFPVYLKEYVKKEQTNKHNNSLVIADIFDSRQYKNSNICILGCSGAGKTFTMQTMALRMRRKGIQVFIIAPLKGHEFYRAARNVGGEFIQISPASKNCINIMEIRKVDNSVNELLDGPTLDASALAGKIQRLHIFFSLLIPDMSHEEKQLLDEALIKTYARKGITHKNESLTDPQHPEQYKKMPILEDVYNVLLESEDTKRLAHILNRLVHGSASSFNQQTNVDLTNKYTVLDISELTGSSDLLTVGMFVALDYVWDKAKENRTEEKAIFVDEVWQLIGASSNRLAAEFVLEILVHVEYVPRLDFQLGT